MNACCPTYGCTEKDSGEPAPSLDALAAGKRPTYVAVDGTKGTVTEDVGINEKIDFVAINIAVMTVSDTRTELEDKSGDTLVDRLQGAGHNLAARAIMKDETDAIVSQLQLWIDDPKIDAVLATGGTGVTGRDVTPEAFQKVFDKEIPGFGELFRMLSYEKIGTSTIQSRATAGVAKRAPTYLLYPVRPAHAKMPGTIF